MAVADRTAALGDVSRWELLRAPATMVGGLALASAALYARDPHVPGSWGVCPSLALFGVYCPGCGGLRAVNDLTHLDVAAAASSNLLFVAFLPMIAWVTARWVVASWRGEHYVPRRLESAPFYIGLVGLMVVFMVVRNLSFGSWLAP